MTDIHSALEEIRERLEKATPGPWISRKYEIVAGAPYPVRVVADPDDESIPNVYDKFLIAHAPTDISKLLRVVELQAEALMNIEKTPPITFTEKQMGVCAFNALTRAAEILEGRE